MVPLAILFNEYIDRPKLTDQKTKKPVEHIFPSLQRLAGTIILDNSAVC